MINGLSLQVSLSSFDPFIYMLDYMLFIKQQ